MKYWVKNNHVKLRKRFAFLPVRIWLGCQENSNGTGVVETNNFIWLKSVVEMDTLRGWTAYKYLQVDELNE